MAPRSTCPISGALDLFGDRWTLLILRDMLFARKSRFGEFQASAEGIASNILSSRLTELEANGLILKRPDPEDGRRQQYYPTDRGLSLIPVLLEVTLWGDAQIPGVDQRQGLREMVEQDREGAIAALTAELKAARDGT